MLLLFHKRKKPGRKGEEGGSLSLKDRASFDTRPGGKSFTGRIKKKDPQTVLYGKWTLIRFRGAEDEGLPFERESQAFLGETPLPPSLNDVFSRGWRLGEGGGLFYRRAFWKARFGSLF